ncbi:zinc finger CCCH domain-containing protein 46 isoform X2 [Sesamum indicum]|uniref:Zinc finger CCCH domain-containing protein 46 isoform X2 n=1 Tax=Sesamum indicum TaxID=4182 RepID=A0A8M8V0P0_SESIN|nr:zinc finger CCCH domain-containing protein 46 isoform X2 [Sesamum indicum]
MDAYEATKLVMTRIQSLDPENATRIMGYILIQDRGEEEMIRLAFGPESLLLSLINQAKAYLGLPSNTPSPKPLTPLASPISPNSPFPQTSPRILIPNNNGFHLGNPSSTSYPRNSPRPVSYAAVLNGSTTCSNSDSSNGPGSPSLHFYGGNDFGDEFLNGGGPVQRQVQDQLPFLDDSVVDPIMSPSGRSDSLMFPYGEDLNSIPSPHPHPFHRGDCSVNDAAFLSNLEEVGGGGSGFGWRPCMYFARGFCKNGSSCKFLHSDIGGGEAIEVGSPSSMFDEFLRMKALQQQQQQQRFALMSPRGHHPFPYNKRMSFLNENLRHDYSSMGLAAGASPSSRQIYLTFPADSTFKEEDVSSYFSMFGPVEDVRIPYQQKRMFGFVTFAYPETVRLILAKGNPHFLCDSRVLVKPYKEKGKIPDRKQLQQQHQHLERGEYSPCLSPSGIDSRELFDLPIGSRMFLSTQEMLRRRLEQETFELQSRRMMSLQLMELRNQHHNNHFLPGLPAGVPVSSPRSSELLMSQNFIASSDATNQDSVQADNEKLLLEETKKSTTTSNITDGNWHQNVDDDDSYLPKSLEHILPDNLFASPTKLAAERRTIFSHASTEAVDTTTPVTSSNNTPVLTSSSPPSKASTPFSRTTSH